MNPVLRWLFFAFVVRPVVTVVLGLNVRHRERLPKSGPAIIAANHNSHLDTLVLMSLFPLKRLPILRPVAAQDYFFRTKFLKWFSLNLIGIIPLDRGARRASPLPPGEGQGVGKPGLALDNASPRPGPLPEGEGGRERRHPLAPITEALDRGDIVILFPEGSRGEPEQLADFKAGIAHVAERHPAVPVHPVYLHGLGKALPRGEAILVPFFCDVFAGEPLTWPGERRAFMADLSGRMTALAAEGRFPVWD